MGVRGTTSGRKSEQRISRRALLKGMGLAPLLLRPAPFSEASHLPEAPETNAAFRPVFPFAEVRLTPHYPTKSPMADLLRLVPPGSDEFRTEKYAFEIDAALKEWGRALKTSPSGVTELTNLMDAHIQGCILISARESTLRSDYGIDTLKRQFDASVVSGRDRFVEQMRGWLHSLVRVETAEFEIYSIEQLSESPLAVRLDLRYDLVGTRTDARREERVGSWSMEWVCQGEGSWKARRWAFGEEKLSVVRGPVFVDVTAQAMSTAASYASQLEPGVDYWRTLIDGACGIDVYNNTGIAAGDFDNDSFDDLYVCQASGLPNRLYRNRGDGTFEDVTEQAGVAVLDNTACALFADFRNSGLQDLLVVCATGPLLFLNRGNGTFSRKPDAFRFAHPPQGSFTHAAVADYDRDGRLDIYFCTYMYYLGLEQYHYPAPYYDARNGPPNCLLHNEGDATFIETTETAGLNVDNNRYSFACAWGDSRSNGLQDLFVSNDFGTSQLYRNNGNGTFVVASKDAGVEDVGAGMGCCWCDYDNDGHQDVYVPSMWEAAGQRVSGQKQFHEGASQDIRLLYQRHARGNALYRNSGHGRFDNVGRDAGVDMGRWSWCSDFWDFDHDGYSDLYVTNGYVSGQDRNDLASFFWRQVVAKSPDDASSSLAYEQGWGAINELIRSDSTWNGYARNTFFVNNRDDTFSEASGPAGLDFTEDGRSFALADLDHDGRLEIILRNRNGPQLRILRNVMKDIGHSVSFRLRGQKSNRDAIGTAITVTVGGLRQTRYLQAGSGFLAQHSKELFFGVGNVPGPMRVSVRWPSGLIQQFENVSVDNRIEMEEGAAEFKATPYGSSPPSWQKPGKLPLPPIVPSAPETWLIEPLRAPGFSLPDVSGRQRELEEWRGRFILLYFWATTNPRCRSELRQFEHHREESDAHKLDILGVNIDEPNAIPSARSLVLAERLSFPVLFADTDMAGIYNIIYRYLFDRRRDLAIPTSFLVDPDGMIIKVYGAGIDVQRLLADITRLPANPGDRMRKALPFPGKLYQSAFLRNDFTYGVALFQHGYLDAAEQSFRQVVAVNPGDADAYYNLGTLNLRRNRLQEAHDFLQQSLSLRPNYPEAWNNLGMIAAQRAQSVEAVRDFQQSLELRPNYGTALLNLGNVYRQQRDYARAGDYLGRALSLQPDDPETNYSVGMLHAQQNQMQQAQEYLQKSLTLRPDYPEALNNLGVLYVRMRNYSQAELEFTTCIHAVPEFEQSYMNLANLYAMEGAKDRAKSILQELLRIQPANENAERALDRLQ